MFSELVIAYLFLGGTGGGACVVVGALGLLADGADVRASLPRLFRDEKGLTYGRFFGWALTAALGALGLGIVCLLADLGRPDRLLLVLALQPATYLGVGAWALGLCAALTLAATLAWRGILAMPFALFRALHGALGLAGLVTVLYTGLLLSDMPSVPLWDTPWLVAVFALSGISCGIALVVVSAVAGGSLSVFATVARRLLRLDSALILLEVVALGGWLWAVSALAAASAEATATGAAAQTSLAALLSGDNALWFWLGLGAVGLAVPLVLEALLLHATKPRFAVMAGRRAKPRTLPAASALTASICVLTGGAALRYVVVAAAVLPVPVYPF